MERRVLQSRAFDAALAAAALALSLALASTFLPDLDIARRVAAIALLVVHTGVLAWRRSSPWVVLAVNLASGIALVAVGMPMVVLHVAPLVAIYSAAASAPRARAIWALAAGVATLVAGQLLTDASGDASTVFGNLVVLGAVWTIGTIVHSRQSYVLQLEERTRELQQAREELARSAVAEERLRIARELHDVVAHSLSVIAVQSGVGAHVMDEQPERAKTALETIEQASRQALGEMRRMLGMLREGPAGQGLTPTRGSAHLEELIDNVKESGIDASLHRDGEQRELPPGVDLTVYRLVQEALTNVVKHAHATRARVTVTYGARSVAVEVVDDGIGSGREGTSEGHGLLGMRERVGMFEGRLEAGPLSEGGWRVRAELPLEKESA